MAYKLIMYSKYSHWHTLAGNWNVRFVLLAKKEPDESQLRLMPAIALIIQCLKREPDPGSSRALNSGCVLFGVQLTIDSFSNLYSSLRGADDMIPHLEKLKLNPATWRDQTARWLTDRITALKKLVASPLQSPVLA